MLSAPLRDRFGVIQRLEFYNPEELSEIILRSADVLNISVDPPGAMELARRSRGTPRLANRLLKRVRDYAQVKYDGQVTEAVAREVLDILEVDRYGLDSVDRNILWSMIEKFGGGRWDWKHWRPPLARIREHLRMSMSLICCKTGSCSGHRGGVL